MRPNRSTHSTPPPFRRREIVEDDSPTPICRCRVLYLGSSVPCVTKDGLQGIQEPLKELYPDEEEDSSNTSSSKGIDSWLSVWSNGFLLENIDENRKKVTRFFPIESLHYCAAVRYVLVPGSLGEESKARFLPLDSPFAKNPYNNHPPLFAAILRRTSGIKVLECHVFICKKETAANALVRCSFHSYADSTYAKNLENGGPTSLYGTLGPSHSSRDVSREYQQSVIEVSEDSINSIEKVEEWKVNGNSSQQQIIASVSPKKSPLNQNGKVIRGNPDEISVYNGDDNHKIWAGKTPPPLPVSGEFHGGGGGGGEMIYDYGSTLRSVRSNSSRSKPRQMLMPASPPPPPIREEDGKDSHHHHQHHLLHLPPDGNTNRKDKKKSNGGSNTMKKKTRSKSRERRQQADTQSLILNGRSTLNGGTARKISSTGSLVGGARGYPPPPAAMMGHHGHPSLPPPPPPPPPMLMTLRPGKKAGTFSSRSKSSRAPFLMVPPGPPLMLPPRHVLEEPIYMPHNARPLSPIASYQPGHFPHEAYYNQQQYATIDKASHKAPHRPRARNEEEAELFRNKGHMNERAFSHSIRNEHRSRSYGSLASDLHDEKEAMRQMMAGMRVNGEGMERSEVPPGLYHHHMHPHFHEGPPLPPPTTFGGGKGTKNKKKR